VHFCLFVIYYLKETYFFGIQIKGNEFSKQYHPQLYYYKKTKLQNIKKIPFH
jgi:hypothetical protein